MFGLTAVTLINDPLIAARLPGNTVHTLGPSLSHTPLALLPPVASCPADTHTQITLQNLLEETWFETRDRSNFQTIW